MRSLTEPNGFWLSSLARMRTSGSATAATRRRAACCRSGRARCRTLAMVSTGVAFPIGRNLDGRQRTGSGFYRRRRAAAAFGGGARSPDDRRLLGDRAVDDAVAAQRRVGLVAETHDGLVPPGSGDWRRRSGSGRLGVGVAVHDPDDLPAVVLGVALGPLVVDGIDGVDPGRPGGVAAAVEPVTASPPPARRAARTPRTGSPGRPATMSSTTPGGDARARRRTATGGLGAPMDPGARP